MEKTAEKEGQGGIRRCGCEQEVKMRKDPRFPVPGRPDPYPALIFQGWGMMFRTSDDENVKKALKHHLVEYISNFITMNTFLDDFENSKVVGIRFVEGIVQYVIDTQKGYYQFLEDSENFPYPEDVRRLAYKLSRLLMTDQI